MGRKMESYLQCSACGNEVRYNKRLLEDSDVYLALKTYRWDKASSLQIPAFLVFSNRSLREMSYHHPTTENELLKIHGVGEEKLSLYGPEVLAILQGLLPKLTDLVNLDQYCGSCEGGQEHADMVEPLKDPNNPKMANPLSQPVCKTCGRSWNGIRRRGKKLGDIVDPGERANTFTKELSKNGTDRVIVTIQAITMLELGTTVDDYISNPKIGRVFNSDDTGPFLFLPEWVSRPMNYLGDNNQGYWEITFQHSYRRT